MLYKFIHVPKCGGTTIKRNFEKGYNHEAHHAVYFENDGANYLLLVRNPFDRTISHYRYNTNGRDRTIKEWWENAGDLFVNFQTKFLMKHILHKQGIPTEKDLEQICKIIKRFFFVGTTENLSTTLPKIIRSVGLKVVATRENVSDKPYKVSNEEKKLIERNTQLDLKLWKFVRKLEKTKGI